ncbi:cytochrome P460 family protein [Terriglobus albidus]|uniref:cytochrome P460 family protein n=1 Tax=Terriglobus albidus TaxID=1592106 RepID=UPI0021DFA10D|nr:cytochrome P460 family protein [Terriglobus albidus]
MKQLLAAMSVVLLLSGCSPKPPKTVYPRLNREAETSGLLSWNQRSSWNPRSGRVITSWVNPGGTMTTLYGDDAAVNYARSHADGAYPAGAKLGAVTWKQQEDARWFGGRIPAQVASVEIVTAGGSYARYEGSPLTAVPGDDTQRAQFLLHQRAAVMP